MENTFRCPVCDAPLAEDPDSGFRCREPCPYRNTRYPEFCSLHDKLYFGKWRKMDAGRNEIRRAYARLDGLISRMREVVRKERVPQAMEDVSKALDALSAANPEEEPYDSVKHMDRALSYVHHAINDLLLEKGDKPHSPADYERHYDAVTPFLEDA
ncbi:MAG: hypothetical protein IH577_03765 [Deltaproteobacteria bacterium]|nr:hypothetical protein [Deltaproteobacteria bacterium]